MTKILGIDLGQVRIGLAVSDELGLTAQGLPSLRRGGPEADLAALRAVVQREGVQAVVVGLPRNMDGSLGPAAQAAEAFAAYLRRSLDLPVALWDERLTTRAAERMLVEGGVRRARRRQVVDRVAAALILQGYLDRRQAAAAAGSPGCEV